MQKTKLNKNIHFHVKEPLSTISLRSTEIPNKDKQNSGSDGSFGCLYIKSNIKHLTQDNGMLSTCVTGNNKYI